MSFQMWSFHPGSHYASGMSLIGYEVRATDGPVGAVHEAAEEIGSTYVVVDTDPWTAGGRLLLPPRNHRARGPPRGEDTRQPNRGRGPRTPLSTVRIGTTATVSPRQHVADHYRPFHC